MAAAYARGDHRPDPPPARRERLRVPGRRLGAAAMIRPPPPWFAERRGARARSTAVSTRPYDPRAPGRDRGGDRERRGAADQRHRGLGRRGRAARAPAGRARARGRGRWRGTGTAARRSSRARCAPPAGGRWACSRSPRARRSRLLAPRTCAWSRSSPTSPRSRSSARSCSTARSAAAARSASSTRRPRGQPPRSSPRPSTARSSSRRAGSSARARSRCAATSWRRRDLRASRRSASPRRASARAFASARA